MRILIASMIFGDKTAPGANYSNAVERMGGTAFFCGRMDIEEARRAAEEFDGLVLAGGGDMDASFFGQENHPMAKPVPRDRDLTELRLAQSFIVADKPILAICRGVQVLNVGLGGDLIQHIDPDAGFSEHENADIRHDVDIVGGILAEIFPGRGTISVNSTHHQAVGRLGDNLTVNARSRDGIIEAVSAGENVLGVQFHPERMLDEGLAGIWRWFAAKVRERV